jgi:hypothetical protein
MLTIRQKEGAMSDAYYYKGLTIEFDLSGPKLFIEGRGVPTKELSGLFAVNDPPDVKSDKLRRYGERSIEQWPGLKKREAARRDHLAILKKGIAKWNNWRRENPTIRPHLYDSDLTKEALRTTLEGADFANAVLINSDLRNQNLQGANFHEANLGRAKLHNADLSRANFCRTDLYETQMLDAKLHEANLQGTQLAKTDFTRAKLIGCKVYGMSAWDLKLDGAEQKDLIVRYRRPMNGSDPGGDTESQIMVDNLQLAQFIYLLLNNKNIRAVFDTIGEKGVLILGRFTENRKLVLDAIRDGLRELGFVPMMFDFDRPTDRDFTETIKTLAGLSRFIVADITNPRSSPLELQATMPDYMIPFVPIIHQNEEPFSMFRDLKQKYGDWILDLLKYDSADGLLAVLEKAVVKPALDKADQLRLRKQEVIHIRHVKDYQ